MGTFRTRKLHEEYRRHRASLPLDYGCALCKREDLVAEFTHWKIIKNRFPYDEIAEAHDMIIPKRHCVESDITEHEWLEFNKIKRGYCNKHYEFIIEPTQKMKSIPEHFHLHLITAKKFDAQEV